MSKPPLVGVVGAFGSAAVLTFACATGDHPTDTPTSNTFGTDSGVGDGTAGDTECIPEEGTLWCGRRENAYYIQGGQAVHVEYAQLDAPEGCACVRPEDHEVLEDLLVSGEVPWDDLEDGGVLEEIRTQVFGVEMDPEEPNDAVTECVELVPLDGPGGDPYQNDCDAESSLDTAPGTPGTQFPGIYENNRDGDSACTFERCYEELVKPSLCSFMDGSYDVTLVQGVYEIGSDLFNDVMAYPGCLLEEPGRVEAASGGGYEITGITTGDLLDDLGLQNGDKPVSVNGKSVSTVDGAYNAFTIAYDEMEDEFTFIVTRGGSNTTLEYEVVK